MLENFLGEDVFQSGIQKYLNKYQFKNAATPDLWAALQEAYDETEPTVDLNVTRVMNTWTLQMGLPVLYVTMKKGSGTGGTITITQSRFLVSTGNKKQSKAGTESPYEYKWDIPVTFVTKGQTPNDRQLEWLYMEEKQLQILITQPWIKVNTNQTGFYRVNYDADLWYMLTLAYYDYQLETALTPVDRSSLLDDAFSLAEAGQLAYSTAFDLASALTVEKDYIPWATASACFKKMTPLMRGKLAYKNYVEFLQSRVETIYDSHGPGVSFQNHIDIRLQLTVLDFACSAEDRGCLESAGDKFTTYVDAPPTGTSADLRLWVYTYGMQEVGNAESWKTVWDRYLATTDPQERSELQRSLACIRDAAVLEMYIELAWNEMYVKGQDYFKVLEYISDNPVGTLIVWDYVRVNWPRMVDRFTVNNRYLGNLIPAITKTFDTELKLQEMHDFFAAYPDAGAGANARAQALERVEANIEWVKTYYPVVATWLESFKPGPGIK